MTVRKIDSPYASNLYNESEKSPGIVPGFFSSKPKDIVDILR